jgi:G3E family GTPase
MTLPEDAGRTDGRMRLTVLGGFLGSGKTTWLRHQLHQGAFSDALVIVNEAADTPVDDALLTRSARTEVLAGGCACCVGRDALVSLLRAICDRRVSSDDPADRVETIVLETSGLADPEPIVEAIHTDPVLVHHLVVREIVVAVDALHGLGQLRAEPLGRRQVAAADRLVVTKVDAADAKDVARLVATLGVVNPGALVSASAMGVEAETPEAGSAAPEALPEPGGPEAAPITATRIQLDEATDWPAFAVWLSALLHARGDDVMRVKGVVRTPAGRLLIQSVRKVVQNPERLPDLEEVGGAADNALVFLGRGFTARNLERSLRHFTGAGSA